MFKNLGWKWLPRVLKVVTTQCCTQWCVH